MTTFVLGVDGKEGHIAAVSYKRRKKGLYSRKLVLLDELTGSTLWVSSRRSRQFVSGVPWSSSYALTGESFLYVSKRGRLFALEFEKGGSLWDTRAPHGFVPLGTKLAVGMDRPYTYSPQDGTRKSWDVDAIMGPMVGAGPQVVARTRDGAIHGFDPATGRSVWSVKDEFDPRTPLTTVPVSQNMALLRIVYPRFLSTATLKTEKWECELPGTPKGDPMVSGNIATYLVNDTRRFRALVSVNLDNGSILCTREVNVSACTHGEGMVVCRHGRNLMAVDQKTCNLLKSKDFSKQIRFVTADGRVAALQLTDRTIVLTYPGDGKVLMSQEIRIKGAPVELRDVMDTGGGRYVILVRTIWADKPRLDRIYGVVYDENVGRVVREIKLGKPTPRYREARYVEGPERVKMHSPVWKGEGGLVVSCLDGLCQGVDPGTGRARRSFLLPGKGPASLVGVLPGRVALVERGDRLFAVGPRPSLKWQTGVRLLESRLVTRKWLFYGNLDELVVIDASTGKRVKHKIPHGYRPEAATADAWYFSTSRGGVVYRNAKPHKEKAPYRYDMLGDMDGLVYASSRKVPTRGAWYGVALADGRVAWKKEFKAHPQGSGLAKDLSGVEPREDSVFPPSWISACDQGFLVPDPSHRCLYLVDPKTGGVKWSHCFFRLGGPPLVRGEWILLPAVGPHAPAGKPPKGEVPEGEGRLAVYAVHAGTGKARKVYEPPKPYSVMMPLAASGMIPVTLFEEHRVRRGSVVVGLRFSVPAAQP